ncbi:YHYH domain-containing protein [Mesorhizobium sp. M0959]
MAFACLFLIVWSHSAAAHSGGTDSNGCHTNHKTGDYHCH